MTPIRLHPRVYDDIEEALAHTLAEFGPRQVPVYARLIVQGRLTLRRHPTIGQLHPELGPDIRVFCIASGRIRAPHGYIYKLRDDGVIHVARLVHLARYLPDLLPEDFVEKP
jgi:plasmid stabilization system protein ParE